MRKINRISSLIIALGFALGTQASGGEVEKPAEKLPALQVTVKCVAPDGKIVGEAMSYIAQHPGQEFGGKLPINVGGDGTRNLLIVEFSTWSNTKSHLINFEVSDTSLLQQGIKDGTSSIIPLELLDVEMPRTTNEEYTIYSNESHKLSISFKAVETASLEPNK